MKWTTIIKDDYRTYPEEGINVLVSNDDNDYDDDEAIADLFMPELTFPDEGEFFEFNRPDTRVLRHYVGALDFESVALPDGRFQAISYSILIQIL